MNAGSQRSARLFGAVLALLAGCGCPPPAAEPAPVEPGPSAQEQPTPPPTPEPVVVRETWAGTAVLPTELQDVVVHLEQRDGAWSGTLDVPAAKLSGLALSDIAVEPEGLAFTFKKEGMPQAAWKVFRLAREANAKIAAGVVTGAAPLPAYVKLVELGEGEAPHPTLARPQTPQPPYPYGEREVVVDAPEDGKLAGTLTIPAGEGKHPALLLITGSGSQDRDETIFAHRPYRLIADHLTRAGFAVLRLDDRGSGKTQGKTTSLDTDIGDAQASLAFLFAQPEVDPARVGIIGHSVGGMIAPIVATRSKKKVAFIVTLAGAAMPGRELVPLQVEAGMVASGAPADVAARLAEVQRKLGEAAFKGDPAAVRKAAADALAASAQITGQPAPTGAALDAAVDAMVKQISEPWTATFFRTDPRPAWSKIKVPVLLLNGDKDTQVPAKANLDAASAALKKAGNKDVTARSLPGLNHLFQHADKGTLDEYQVIEETFDPATLDELTAWLVKRAKLGK